MCVCNPCTVRSYIHNYTNLSFVLFNHKCILLFIVKCLLDLYYVYLLVIICRVYSYNK